MPEKDYYIFESYYNNSNQTVTQTLSMPYYYLDIYKVIPNVEIDSLSFFDDKGLLHITTIGSAKSDGLSQLQVRIPKRYFSISLFSEEPSDIEPEAVNQIVKNVTINQNYDSVNPLIIEPSEGYDTMSAVAAVVQVPQASLETNYTKALELQDNDNLFNLTQTNYNKHFLISPNSGYDGISSGDISCKLTYRTLTSNGVYTALNFRGNDTTLLGFYKINVNVPQQTLGTASVTLTNSSVFPITINASSYNYDGLSSLVIASSITPAAPNNIEYFNFETSDFNLRGLVSNAILVDGNTQVTCPAGKTIVEMYFNNSNYWVIKCYSSAPTGTFTHTPANGTRYILLNYSLSSNTTTAIMSLGYGDSSSSKVVVAEFSVIPTTSASIVGTATNMAFGRLVLPPSFISFNFKTYLITGIFILQFIMLEN